MSIEFEIEAELKDISILEPFLSTMDFVEEKEQVDIYYDTSDKKLYDKSKAVFIRNRNNNVIDIKSNDENPEDIAHLSCEETRYQMPLSKDSEDKFVNFISRYIDIVNPEGDYLSKFGLEELGVVKKYRKKYANEDFELVIDKVEGLGEYFEIEVKKGNPEELLKFVKDNNIDRLPLGYLELYLRKHDFDTYMTGRFLLEEDR